MKRVAVLGYGGRGRIYAQICRQMKRDYRITAVIEINPSILKVAQKEQKLKEDQLFLDYDMFLSQDRNVDLIMICTQDRQHFEHTIKALEHGYDVLLEKPIATTKAECLEIEKRAKQLGRKITVCHVLRYTGFFTKLKQLIDSRVIGKIISIEHTENVCYWHQSHSFVRGDWRNSDQSTPMILAKCCHDLDLICWMAGCACTDVASVGDLCFFNQENAPQGSVDRCTNGCKVKKECPYDAEKLYIDTYRRMPYPFKKYMWPNSRLPEDHICTLPKLQQAIREGDFGKCVYRCDNNVVDYQQVQMRFENGIHATLIMTAFSNRGYRGTTIRGGLGEIQGEFEKGKITLQLYGRRKKVFKVPVTDRFYGHGGGDKRMIEALAQGLIQTNITQSVESHLAGFAAEESRLGGGRFVKLRADDRER